MSVNYVAVNVGDSQLTIDAEARHDVYVRFRKVGFNKAASLFLAAALNPPWQLLIESPYVSETLLQALKEDAESANYRVGELIAGESWERAVSRAYETLQTYAAAGIEHEEWGILGYCSTWIEVWHKTGGGPMHRSAPYIEVDGETYMPPDLLLDDEQVGTEVDFGQLIEVERKSIAGSIEHFSDPAKRRALLEELQQDRDFLDSLSPIPDEWKPRVESFEYWLKQGLGAASAWLVSAATNPPLWLILHTAQNYKRDMDLAVRRFHKTGTRMAAKGKTQRIPKQAIKALHDYFAIARRHGDAGMAAVFVLNIGGHKEMVANQLVKVGQQFDEQQISELISLEMGVYAHATSRPADFNLP